MSLKKHQAISIRNAHKMYGNNKDKAALKALNGIHLSVNQGDFFGLLGPNGAGKSTLINAMAGLLRLNEGEISVSGADVVKNFRQARSKLGVVPQEIVIDPFFTVRQTLQFQSGYFGIRNNDDWINELLFELNLLDKAETNMRQLSGGMKRRVLIAQALVHKPEVLVLDEPTAGVDVGLRQTMWRFIRKLHQQGTTVVLTTHYLEEAEQLCETIAIIDCGEIVALDSKEQLLSRGIGKMLHITTKQTITSIPDFIANKVLKKKEKSLQIRLDEGDEMMQILGRLQQSGLSVDEASIERGSLEDIFVDLTSQVKNAGV